MGNTALRKVPEERAATSEEIHGAIAALTKTEWYRLKQFADFHVAIIGSSAGDRRGKDLLNEAFKRLLEGTRKWDKTKVQFLGFLYGAMESIADSWLRKKASPTEHPVLASDLIREREDGEVSDPAEEFRATGIRPDQMLIYRETLDQIDGLFSDDEKARMLIEALREGYDPPGVREFWGWSQPEYNAIILRVRRHLIRSGIGDPRKSHHVQ